MTMKFRDEMPWKTGDREVEFGGISWCLIRELEPLRVIGNKECISHNIPYIITGVD